MTKQYGVDSLHLNVGDRDCTIHLLLELEELPPKKTIAQCILVDTGPANASKGGSQIVSDAINTISSLYNSPNLKLDAIVVSSWHPDYYGGLFEMLDADILAPGFGSRAKGSSGNDQIQWMKYDDKGSPLTILYTPGPPTSSVREMQFDGTEAGLTYRYIDPMTQITTPIKGFCKLVCQSRDLLGRNLISGQTSPVDFEEQPAESVLALLQRNVPGAGQPGLYCIAANSTTICSEEYYADEEGSIGLVLIWNEQAPRIAYYGGGTVGSALEEDILNWITNSTTGTAVEPLPITTLNLTCSNIDPVSVFKSVDRLNPQNIIMSSGSKFNGPAWELIILLHTFLMSRVSAYAPSKPVYCTQYPFYFIKEADGKSGRYKNFTTGGQISYDCFVRPAARHDAYHAGLAALYERVNKQLKSSNHAELISVYDDFCLWVNDNPKHEDQDAADWITEQCEHRWAQISPVTARSHEATGGAQHGASSQPVGMGDLIEYICVESRDNSQSKGDGRVTVKYHGQSNAVPQEVSLASQKEVAEKPLTESKDIGGDTTKTLAVLPLEYMSQGYFSQFPSSSLSKIRNSASSHVTRPSVLTNKDIYDLEAAIRPPDGELEIFSDEAAELAKARKAKKEPDSVETARLQKLRDLKASRSPEGGNLDQCIASSKLNRRGAAGTPVTLKVGDVDNFVASLHTQGLWLSEKVKIGPTENQDASSTGKPTKPVTQPTLVTLHAKDELYSWFAMALGATSMKTALTDKQTVGEIALELGPGRSFSTKHIMKAFNLPTDSTPKVPGDKSALGLFSQEMTGLLAAQNTLLLGLDPETTPDGVTFKDALTTFGFGNIVNNTWAKMLSDLRLTLDVADGSRNAIWFDPDSSYRSTLRLQYKCQGSDLEPLKACFVQGLIGFEVVEALVVLKKVNSWTVASGKIGTLSEPECDITLKSTITINSPNETKPFVLPVQGTMRVSQQSAQLDIMIDTPDVISKLVDWVKAQNVDKFNLMELLSSKTAQRVLDKLPQIRRLALKFDLDKDQRPKSVSSVTVDIELLVKAGTVGKNNSVLFLFTFNWTRGQGSRLRGSLWLKPSLTLTPEFRKLLPNWEAFRQLNPINSDYQGDCVDLKTFGKVKSLPQGVPSRVTQATVEISMTGISFGGTMISEPPLKDSKPRAYLGRILLRAGISWEAEFSFRARLDIDVAMVSCDIDPDTPPARLLGTVAYANGVWQLGSIIKDFRFSYIYALLSRHTKVALTTMLRFLKISYLSLVYRYEETEQGFKMIGLISLGDVEFDILYRYGDPKGKSPATDDGAWELSISTPGNRTDRKTKLRALIEALSDGDSVELPSFAGNIEIGAVKLKCQQVTNAQKKPEGVCLVLTAAIDDIEFVFASYRNSTLGTDAHTKRFLKITMVSLPELVVPLLGEIKQPIDEIFFAYVQDMPPRAYLTDVTKMIGLTLRELGYINTALAGIGIKKKLIYQKTRDEDSMNDKDAVIAAGFHFMMIGVELNNETRVILDYVFGTPKPSQLVKRKEEPANDKTTAGPSKEPEEEKQDDPTKPGEKPGARPNPFDKPVVKPGTRLNPAKPGEKPGARPNPFDRPVVKPGTRPNPFDKKPDVKPSENSAGKKTIGDSKNGPAQVAPYKKVQGFLTITNLAVEYKGNTLSIGLDGKCVLGPFGANLIGLCLSITFGRDVTLENLKFENVSLSFKGLILAFDRPPLIISGTLLRDETRSTVLRPKEEGQQVFAFGVKLITDSTSRELIDSSQESMQTARHNDRIREDHTLTYSGGFILGLEPWLLQGAGFYQKLTETPYRLGIQTQTQDTQTKGAEPVRIITWHPDGSPTEMITLFIFIKIEGPIISFSSATITGITGAFGYNLKLRWPRVEEVKDFPFVAMHQAAENPLDQLKALTSREAGGWIEPKKDEKWMAAGLKVDIAQVMAVDAILIVQWAPDLRIGLCGVGVCELPSVKAKKKFARVKIGFIATLDPGAGTFRLEAQLAPDSFILDPSCHLRGGLAFCCWWKPPGADSNLNDPKWGDWVLSLGGYHKSFVVPPHYPRPERLSVDWKCDDWVSIRGEAYFAITPKACMAGGMLSITFKCGNLSAWFNAWLDMLINYSPFKFIADGGVSIGINYTLDLLFVSTNIKIHIGATLHIEGPPVRGTVHVDFWVFGFDIEFGDDSKPQIEVATLAAFYELAIQENTKDTSKKPANDGRKKSHTFVAQSGLLASTDDKRPKDDDPWSVRSGTFAFAIACRFPMNKLILDDSEKLVSNEKDMYAKPMQNSNKLDSVLRVQIFRKEARVGKENPKKYEKINWRCETTRKALPRALWDKYDASQDPSKVGNDIGDLLDGNNVSTQFTTGLSLIPPKPEISKDNLAPINASECLKIEAFDSHSTPSFLGLEKSEVSFNPEGGNTTSPQQWEVAAQAWSLERPEAQAVVDFWAKTFLWNTTKDSPKLLAKPPAIYIKKRDSLWMKAPSMAVAT